MDSFLKMRYLLLLEGVEQCKNVFPQQYLTQVSFYHSYSVWQLFLYRPTVTTSLAHHKYSSSSCLPH